MIIFICLLCLLIKININKCAIFKFEMVIFWFVYYCKNGAFCSGSYNSSFDSQSVDQTGVGELSDLALQDLICAMHLEFAVCNLPESKRVREATVCINIYGKLVTETEVVDDSKRQDGRKSVRMVTKFVEGVWVVVY